MCIQLAPNQSFNANNRSGVSNIGCESKQSAPAVQYRITETIILTKCRMPHGMYCGVRGQ